MTKPTWAGLGVLAVLLALPAAAPAMGDGQANEIRTRRVTAIRVAGPASSSMDAIGSPRREVVVLPTDSITPAMPTAEEGVPDTLDLTLDQGPFAGLESERIFTVDAPLARPALSSETQAIIRRELAGLYFLDVQVSPAP